MIVGLLAEQDEVVALGFKADFFRGKANFCEQLASHPFFGTAEVELLQELLNPFACIGYENFTPLLFENTSTNWDGFRLAKGHFVNDAQPHEQGVALLRPLDAKLDGGGTIRRSVEAD